MKQLIKLFGYIISYIYTTHLNQRIQGFLSTFYTGWKSRDFRSFKGYIMGRIEIRGGQYITIGDHTLIEDGVRFLATDKRGNQSFTPEIKIGKNTVIQKNCFLSAVDKIEIGDNVAVTEHCMILDNTHGDFQDNHLTFSEGQDVPNVFLQNVYSRPLASKGPVIIEHDVHIGMFCTILSGTVIGHHSVIAAHSVVARKIPPYSLVAGNPAEVIMTFGKRKKK